MKHTFDSPREQVKALIEGKINRVAKGELCINNEVVCSTLGCEEAGFDERYAFIRRLGLDLVSLSPQLPCAKKELPGAAEYSWPDLGRWVDETKIFTFALLDGAFEWGMRLLGLSEFCCMLRSPLSVRDLTTAVEKVNLALVERLADAGIDGFILADDIAHQKTLFASPKLLREFFIPSLARQVDPIRSGGLPVFFHSDGNYSLVLSDIIGAGFNGLQCLEKSAGMDAAQIRSQYGDTLCLWGHLDVDDIAAANDVSRLREITKSIKDLAEEGPFILGTTSGLFGGIDLSLLKTLYESV